LVLRDPDPLQLFPLQMGTLLVTSRAPVAVCTAGSCSDLPHQDAIGRGGVFRRRVSAAGGVWPTSTWLVVSVSGGDESALDLAKWTGGAWSEVRKLDGPWLLQVRSVALAGDRVLGLASVRPDPLGPAYAKLADTIWPPDRFVLLSGTAAPLPRPARRTSFFELAALDDGTLLAMGELAGRAIVQSWRWPGGSPGGSVEELPLPTGCAPDEGGGGVEVSALEGRGEAAFVAGSVGCGATRAAYVARRERGHFVPIEAPEGRALASISASAHVLWAVTDAPGLFRRSEGAAWVPVPLPSVGNRPCVATSVRALSEDDVYVAARCEGAAPPFALFARHGPGR
jgi:hypothetical protein